MGSIEQALAATRIFRNLTPEQVDVVADSGQDVEVPDGRAMMIEGDPADSFFLIRDGFVALQTQSPAGLITIETLHNGDPVGWSWLFEPYLVHFDARSRGVTRAIRFDAAALRRRCEEDSQLRHELMRSFASVTVERLNATRLQLLDAYCRAGGARAGRTWPGHEDPRAPGRRRTAQARLTPGRRAGAREARNGISGTSKYVQAAEPRGGRVGGRRQGLITQHDMRARTPTRI